MTIRESGLSAAIACLAMLWSAGFAVNTALVADQLTSPQWISLMTVPGGKWFWITVFGGAATVMCAGLTRRSYLLRGVGFGLIGAGCLGIAMFYWVAPWFHLGPVTLGYWSWFLGVGIGIGGAVVNWWPIQWF